MKRCYYGFTSNLRRRFKEHNDGNSKFTKLGIPWSLAYYEAFSNKEDAYKRELQIKRRKNSYAILRKKLIKSIEF